MANISEISIKRPVLSTVMTIILLLFGMIGYKFLGVREFPSVDNPIISVNVTYPGANAEVIMNQITEPLEQNINGIPGIRSLSSVSSQGSCRITVEFELSVDLETAANDVRDKVSRAQRYLPRDCDPPTVSKADADATPIMQIGIRSSKRSLMELSEIAELTVKERLQTIPNVSGVDIWGQKRYSMRLWLDPIKMAGYGITPLDVKNAVDAENVELPSGSIEGNTIDLSIRTLGLMHTATEFNDLIIKRDGDNIIRFQDVGRAEVSPEDLRSVMRKNGEPMVIDVIIPQPGANQIEIADEAYKRIEQLKKDLPEDVTVEMVYDNTRFIRASIAEVEETIYVAFLLVVLIIFLFLRDWRVTLVCAALFLGAVIIPRIIGRGILCDVCLRLLHQCADNVGGGALGRTGGGRRDRDGGEHLRPHRAGNGTERGRYRRGERDILRRRVYDGNTRVRVPPDCLYGRYDGTLVQGVQYRDRRFRNDIFLCGFDLYADVGDQAAEKTRKQRLVVHKDGTVLRRHEQYLCKVAERVPEPQVVVHTDCRDPFRLHRLFLANHPLRTFSIGRPFIHFDQYTCTGRSYLRVHPRLYGPSGRHGRHVGSRAASPNGSCE